MGLPDRLPGVVEAHPIASRREFLGWGAGAAAALDPGKRRVLYARGAANSVKGLAVHPLRWWDFRGAYLEG